MAWHSMAWLGSAPASLLPWSFCMYVGMYGVLHASGLSGKLSRSHLLIALHPASCPAKVILSLSFLSYMHRRNLDLDTHPNIVFYQVDVLYVLFFRSSVIWICELGLIHVVSAPHTRSSSFSRPVIAYPDQDWPSVARLIVCV